jgi:hypothetical protein
VTVTPKLPLLTQNLTNSMLLELNIKTQQDLERYKKILKLGEYSGCTITSKKDNYDFDKVLSELKQIPNLQIIPTFSCKANYSQNAPNTYKNLLVFIDNLKSKGINQILVVSGNPKMKLDTLEVLKQFEDNDINIATAYNPYSNNQILENQRLIEKIKNQNVNQVWLQLGQDQIKLNEAVKFIRNINPQIQIINSILQPTKNLLKSLQFRPWLGVNYTDEFYDNINFALQNVNKMKQLSQQLDLEILISGM